MSKYNLTDILEQYKIGSGWTTDFDYDGMLKTGLGTSIDTPIEVLKKMSDDFEDVNYHRENSHLQDAIDAIEIGDMKEAEGRLNDFHVEIRKTQEDQGMDIEPTLGKFMDSKMEENTEAVDLAIEASQEKAGIKEGDEVDEIAGYDRKGNKQQDTDGSDATKYKKAAMDVKEVTSREGSRIEGLLSIPLKSKFLEAFQDLYFDLVEEDPFMAEDVVDHLGIEMLKHLDAIQAQGDKLAGMDQQEFTAIDEKADKALQEAQYAPEVVDRIEMVRKALFDTSKFSQMEIESYVKSLLRDFDKGDFEAYDDYEADDYVEDMNNYIADKALQEHFKRFM